MTPEITGFWRLDDFQKNRLIEEVEEHGLDFHNSKVIEIEQVIELSTGPKAVLRMDNGCFELVHVGPRPEEPKQPTLAQAFEIADMEDCPL